MLSVVLVGEWEAAVAARRNLGLVGVDEDPRVTSGTTAAVAGDNSVVGPSHRLLVNHLHGRLGLGLSAQLAIGPRPVLE
jgi:hypothetical protein